MGNVLRTGLSLIAQLVTTPFTDTGDNGTSGALVWLKELTTRIFLVYKKYTQKERLDFDDGTSTVYSLGCVANRVEWELELPQSKSSLIKTTDSVSFHTVDFSGSSLTVQFTKEPNNKASVFLCLRLADGSSYVLPQVDTPFSSSDSNRSCSAGGLKIQCLSPMRKWRISFNGLLSRKLPNGQQDDELAHVKFGFIWTALSPVYDATIDITPSSVVSAMSREKWRRIFPEIDRLHLALNEYEQVGQLLGTITVDGGDEQESYFWGTKVRALNDKVARNHSCSSHLYGYVETGIAFHVATVNIPGLVKNLLYGHITIANGLTYGIRYCDKNLPSAKVDPSSTLNLHFSTERKTYTLHVKPVQVNGSLVSWKGVLQEIYLCTVTLNGFTGHCHWITARSDFSSSTLNTSPVTETIHTSVPLVVAFNDEICQDTLLTGGKGSSLARLTAVAKESNLFSVPNGVVVTTEAYKQFIIDDKVQEVISKLEHVAWAEMESVEEEGEGNEKLKKACKDAVNVINSSLTPECISKAVSRALQAEFGSDAQNKLFAVRSSAAGEDTEDMSAAGQMETFLGVKGIDQVLAMLPNCWASQFSFVATGYKRRYGQALDSPMAVVIQEMVPSEIAGVMFTCDPLSGNPKCITITANYGLGESVVSALAEPDTIELQRCSQNALSIRNIKLGGKKFRISMEEDGGTKEEWTESVQNCCLSDTDAVALGKIGIQVEGIFGNPLDIEWAYFGGKAYLLQARPVTSLHSESDFEIMHQLDAGMRTSSEYYTKANVGEVMPGSMSYLGSFVPQRMFAAAFQKYWRHMMGVGKKDCCQYFEKGFGMAFNHFLFNVIDVFCRIGNQDSNVYAAYSLGMFGRIMKNPDMFKMAEVRFQDAQPSALIKIRKLLATIEVMLFAEKKFARCAAKYKNYSVDLSRCPTAIAIFEEIERCWPHFSWPLACFGSCNTPSSFYNMFAMVALSKLHGGWTPEVYNSFAVLLSSCDGVESADVPRSMQDLAYCIAQDPQKAKFQSMDTKEALQWLKTSPGKAGIKFREFLLRHGHRCVKEFDIRSVTWDMDPLPLVKTLQGMVDSARPLQKKETSVREDLAKLGVKIPWTTWLFLRFLIPRCRHSVGLRERAKVLLFFTIFELEKIRLTYYSNELQIQSHLELHFFRRMVRS